MKYNKDTVDFLFAIFAITLLILLCLNAIILGLKMIGIFPFAQIEGIENILTGLCFVLFGLMILTPITYILITS